jgi:hypothetical protein
MKKTMKNYGISVAVLISVFSFAFSGSALANPGNEKPASELKFIGSEQDQLLFQLNLNNQADGEYVITILDEYGNVLYSEKVKGTNNTKTFAFDKNELGDDSVRIKVRSLKTGNTDVYEIKPTFNVVEDTRIKKIS